MVRQHTLCKYKDITIHSGQRITCMRAARSLVHLLWDFSNPSRWPKHVKLKFRIRNARALHHNVKFFCQHKICGLEAWCRGIVAPLNRSQHLQLSAMSSNAIELVVWFEPSCVIVDELISTSRSDSCLRQITPADNFLSYRHSLLRLLQSRLGVVASDPHFLEFCFNKVMICGDFVASLYSNAV